jgi:glycosyltransferase involved in cell wall biosynthesis
MNILVASIYLPWPLDAGGKLALYGSFACLRNDHSFTLICPIWNEKEANDAIEFQARFPEIRVRAINCTSANAFDHTRDDLLLRFFRWGARQYRRRSRATAPALTEEKAPQLPSYPFTLLPEAFVDAVTSEMVRGVDLIQVEFAEMLSIGACLPPEIPKVFIHHQLHFVYAQRFAAARSLSGYSEYLQKVMRIQEEAYLHKFDGVVVFSDEDKRALSGWLKDERIHVSPFPISGGSKVEDELFENRFSFVGSEAHFPNLDGLEWLIREVWPEIAKHAPGATLKVIGPWGEASRVRFCGPGIEFSGYVEDLGNAIRGSVMLVPLRIGSGIRVKLLDAMSHGVPAVSTSIGCEGIPAHDGIDILIRDDKLQFAAAAVEILNNSKLRRQIVAAGRDLVAEHYSPERVRRRRNEIYEKVCEQSRLSESQKCER